MGAYILCVVFTYKLIVEITDKKLAGLVGSLVIALNPNLLYLQTTPMTETLLLATFVMTGYYLSRYMNTKKVSYLIATGIAVMFSTLIRYDGWFMFASLLFLIPVWELIGPGKKKAEGSFFLFASVGGLGILLWIVWNWAIFGQPLYFLFGEYSAYAQQRVLSGVGQLPTEKNIVNAFTYFMWAVVDNNGIVLVISSLISMVVLPFFIANKKYLHVILAVLTPFAFNIIALYAGQSAMNIPQAAVNPGLFNTRYGLVMIPGIAVLLGVLAGKIKYSWILVVLVLCAQSYLFLQAGKPITLVDGQNGLINTYYTVEASKWLADNYTGGLILTSLASHDAFVARAGIPMKNYIHEGNAGYWQRALQYPSATIEYITVLTFPPDSVYKKLADNADFHNSYVKVHSYEKFEIYKRRW